MDTAQIRRFFRNQWPAILMALLLLATMIYAALRIIDVNNTHFEEIRALKQDYDEEIVSSNDDTETALASLEELQSEFFTLSQSHSDIQDKYETLSEGNRRISTELRGANTRLDDMLEIVDCGSEVPSLDANYSGQGTIAESLKDWVGERSGKVISNRWEVVFNNSRGSIHYLTTNRFLFVFLVWFNEPDLYNGQGVFWYSGQCWLETPSSD